MSKSIQLFDGMTDEQVQTILSKLPSRKYKKNHMLIFEDDPIEKIYIIKSGMLKVYRMYEGKELILGFVKKNMKCLAKSNFFRMVMPYLL